MDPLKKYASLLLGPVQGILSVLILIVLIATSQLNFRADMLALLPEPPSALQTQFEKGFYRQYKDNLIVAISGEHAEQAYASLRTQYAQRGWLNEPGAAIGPRELAEFYTQYRGALLSSEDRTQLRDGQTLGELAIAKLSLSFSPLVQDFFPLDPTLITAEFVTRALEPQFSMLNRDGEKIWVNDGQQHLLLFLTLPTQIGDDIALTVEAIEQLKSSMAQLQSEYPNVQFSYSGIPFHSAENALLASQELSVFSTLSLVFVCLLVWWFFKTYRALVGIVATQINAICVGLIALAICFHEVHILALVFSITLIGIAIDYSFHVMLVRHQQQKEQNAIRAAIKLGFISTACGYSAFVFLPLTVLAQVGVFVIFGLAGALCCALYSLPYLTKWSWDDSRQVRCSQYLARFFKLNQNRIKLGSYVVGALAMGMIIISNDDMRDDISLLNASSEQLKSFEVQHQTWLGSHQEQRLLIYASTLEQLLQKEELVKTTIAKENPYAKVIAISNWLPSQKQQTENFALLSNAIEADQLAPLVEMGAALPDYSNYHALSLSALQHSPLAEFITKQYLEQGQYHVSLVRVKGFGKDSVMSVLDEIDQIILFDKAAQYSALLQKMRESLQLWFVIAVLIFGCILAVCFGLSKAVLCSVYLVLVSQFALAVSLLFQGSLNLFNYLALVLLSALAIDYFIVYLQCGRNRHTLMAVTLSALSSIFVFGMLALSQTPAVYSFGYTTVLGIFGIYLLTPLVVRENHEV